MPSPVPADDAALVHWRRGVLLAAGLDDPLATELSRHPTLDLHALLELVDRGCPPHLAARILAPLDDEQPS